MDSNLNLNLNIKNAIDLGCCSGRDTIYLIKNGLNVTAIDKENTYDIILKHLNENEMKRFKFIETNFKDVKLSAVDLIVSNYSLSYAQKDYFYDLWSKIQNAIYKGGYFVGNFFGINDAWNKNSKMIFFTKEDVLKLFKDFRIIYFNENEYDGLTARDKKKHWHIFNVIAEKL